MIGPIVSLVVNGGCPKDYISTIQPFLDQGLQIGALSNAGLPEGKVRVTLVPAHAFIQEDNGYENIRF